MKPSLFAMWLDDFHARGGSIPRETMEACRDSLESIAGQLQSKVQAEMEALGPPMPLALRRMIEG